MSQAVVTCTLQDDEGFMWFGTQEGLNRYDGYTFTVFGRDAEQPASLSHDSVKALIEDRTGILWIGTDGGGLNRFDPKIERFRHFRHDPTDATSLSNDRVWALLEDRSGSLWMGTDGAGLNRFEPTSGRFERFAYDGANAEAVSGGQIRAIVQTPDEAIWIGTDGGGLTRLDPKSGVYTRYRHDPSDPHSLGDDRVRTLYADRDGVLWLGTYQRGLDRFDPISRRFQHLRHDPDDPRSLGSDAVYAIYRDAAGTLWVGTDAGLHELRAAGDGFERYRHDPVEPYSLNNDRVVSIYQDRGGVLWVGTYAGLNRWNTHTDFFRHYKRQGPQPHQLSNNHVTSFQEDQMGGLWIGTYGGGLNYLDRSTATFRHYLNDPAQDASLSDDRVMSLCIDRRSVLWVGTFGGGLNRLNRDNHTFTRFRHDEDDSKSLSWDGVTTIFEDDKDTLWVGTYRGGLNQLDRTTGSFLRHRHNPADPQSLSSDRVLTVHQDRSGTVWVGTDGGGLNEYDPATGSFVRYRVNPADPRSLSSDHIWALVEDLNGMLWIGTQGGGLNGWSLSDRTARRANFKHIQKRDGLPSDIISAAVVDEEGALWLSSSRGLARVDTVTGLVRTYDTSHGLQDNEFNPMAAHRARDGEMFFGGINGFNSFYPAQVRGNTHIPPIAITSFLKFNRPVDLDVAATVELSHEDDVIAFDFAALDYTAPGKNLYRYRLEGFDKDWVNSGTLRRATYTNLEAGDYTFLVTGSNNDGVWNEEGTSLRITVLPAPWETWWAYSGYMLIIGVLLLSYTRAQHRKHQRARQLAETNRVLKREIEAKESAQSASRAKSQFLANISHEIRTPLNGVLGMIELLLTTELTAQQKRFGARALESAKHLLNLLNDVLDVSRIEAMKLELVIVDFDLRRLVEETLALFADSARRKHLRLHCALGDGIPTQLRGDSTRLRQILSNLVGNAVKFTAQGEVSVQVDAYRVVDGVASLRFEVRDTGTGIDPQATKRIFDSFEQADVSMSREYGGAGLGLAISKQLVELMQGDIGVESVAGEGSTFWFQLDLALASQPEKTQSFEVGRDNGDAERSLGLVRILVVEDNPVNQEVVQAMLGIVGAEVNIARDGHDAVDAALSTPYDLILMDCHMPNCDGFEATRAIRQNEATEASARRVPIIAMTADAMSGDRERCLAAGMDDYLSKPFSREQLVECLHNWLGRRGDGNGEEHETRLNPGSSKDEGHPSITDPTESNTLDHRALDTLRSLGVDGQKSVLESAIELYFQRTPELLSSLQEGIVQGDPGVVQNAAHSLKSSSANLGAGKLADLCNGLEILARRGSVGEATDLLSTLESEYERVKIALAGAMRSS